MRSSLLPKLFFGSSRADLSGRLGHNVENRWRTAFQQANVELEQHLLQPVFLNAECNAVVLPQEITTSNEYVRASRASRGTRLNRKSRLAVWRIIDTFRGNNLAMGEVTFEEVTMLAAKVLEYRAQETGQHSFDHVLIDEGQDFHPGHWKLLRQLVAEGPNDLFIAEDSHQRIYGQKVTLSHHGIDIRGRSRRLKLNYRTTAENLRYALGVLEGQE